MPDITFNHFDLLMSSHPQYILLTQHVFLVKYKVADLIVTYLL